MTAELENQSSRDESSEDKRPDEKIQAEDEEEEITKGEERNSPDVVPEDGVEITKPAKKRSLNFMERLFARQRSNSRQRQQNAEAGTELLSKDDRGRAREDGRNDSGTDITIALTDEHPDSDGAAGDLREKEPNGPLTGRAYFRRLILGLLIVFLILLVVTLASVIGGPANDTVGPPPIITDPVVLTECGGVRGVIEDGVYIFRKLPYALPPTGDRRWKPPVAPTTLQDCWAGVYQVQNESVFCHQQPVAGVDMEQSEDCLYLNVFTPVLSTFSLRPVVVYIPGDSLQGYGAADFHWQPPPHLAKEKDVVFVTFSYRTNVFGFMSVDILSKTVHPPTSGNYGFLDQIAVLKWVHKNIQSFGGDPEKITVFGHGSGATSAIVLLTSKKCRDLIAQAWVTGPSLHFTNKTLGAVSEENSVFMKKLQCENMECLLEKDPVDLLQATPNSWNLDLISDFPSIDEEPFPSVAIVDGFLLYDTPLNMWKEEWAENLEEEMHKIPLVIGATAQESGPSPSSPAVETWSWSDFSDYVSERLSAINSNISGNVLEFYIDNSSSLQHQFHTMIADIRVVCPISQSLELAKHALGSEVYSYIVDYVPSAPIRMSNDSSEVDMSVHGLDVVAIFGLLDRYLPNLTAADTAYQNNIQDLFYNFVHSGTPSSGDATLKSGDHVNLIHDRVDIEAGAYSHCQVWTDSELFGTYARRN